VSLEKKINGERDPFPKVKVKVAEGATIATETPEFSVDAGRFNRSLRAVFGGRLPHLPSGLDRQLELDLDDRSLNAILAPDIGAKEAGDLSDCLDSPAATD
jgi:hypothetical protein